MPADTVKKVANTCDMSVSEVEDKGKKAKEKAESQGHAEDGGYVTSIFKNMLSKNCLEKLGGNNNKKESNTMSANRLLEKIDKYLNEAEIDGDQVKEAGKKVAKKIHGEADEKVIDDMISKMKKNNKVKSTEDAIQVITNMLKS